MSATRASTPSKGELTRRAILDAAIARFGRDGYRATAVADIARDASVGGTVAYAYFPNKEALFLAAVDHDAAAVIVEGVSHILEDLENDDWRGTLVFTLIDAVDRHPLARRLLAGLEPEVTARVMDIPALHELRKACAERLRTEQASGRVRPDIDAVAVANGIVTICLSLLRAVVQIGSDVTVTYAADVAAVFAAALDPVPPPAG
ncbi:MAG TPA: TetR/AcrR family transcriptional regulator [Acidimicrobiales bacterium]|nr:TetR/AcrR family transcriptional regulator [Acidimicrobiales bacterium]